MWTGERQSTKMRIKYLEAALSQDIQYFDTQVRTSDIVFAINTDAALVQDAISEKVKAYLIPSLISSLLIWNSHVIIKELYYIYKKLNGEFNDMNIFVVLQYSWVVSFTTWQHLQLVLWWDLLQCGN